jgi:hypothetical protein
MRSRDKQKFAVPEQPVSFASRFLRPRYILPAVILLASAFMIIRVPIILKLRLKNGEFLLSNYRMKEEKFDHPRLQSLRQREHLDKVVERGQTEFEKIILLRKWTHDQWAAGETFYYPPWDALEILDLARKYHNRGFCAQYAIVFLQACQSLGLHARYVDLPGHFATAVWSDDFNRWIIMDPSSDIHFERNGLPMTGRELSGAFWKGQTKGINSVSSNGARTPIKKSDLEFYRGYSIDVAANQLSIPVTVTVNNQTKTLTHQDDYRNYPFIGRDQMGITSSFLAWDNPGINTFEKDRPGSNDPDDFRYLKNQTLIFIGRFIPTQGRVKIVLQPENSETFDKFQCKIDANAWQSIAQNEILWDLHPGMNKLAARIQTHYNWTGPISETVVYYKPAYWPWRKKAA